MTHDFPPERMSYNVINVKTLLVLYIVLYQCDVDSQQFDSPSSKWFENITNLDMWHIYKTGNDGEYY